MDIATLILGAFLGGIPSWLIGRHFANKSKEELDQSIEKQTSMLASNTTFNNYERMLRTAKWNKEQIDNKEVWVCERNNTFQFYESDDNREFNEAWTSVFPDQNTTMFHINLTIGGTIVKSLPFISADGGRYTLPLPELIVAEDKPSFYWSTNSVEVKIAELIGNFYRFESLGEVAQFTKVELHTVSNHA